MPIFFSVIISQLSFGYIHLQIIFVEDKKLESTLLRDVDENQLPETYGGKLPLVPIQDC